ncbi:MAG: hypothetical protein ACR2PJ_04465 [Pseudomonadales bacterium]
MSFYRFVRAGALLEFLRRYQIRVRNIAAAIAVALVANWLYADIAAYLETHHPDWSGWALTVKTLIIAALLAYIFWQVHLGTRGRTKTKAIPGDDPTPSATSVPATPGSNGPLDELAKKPKLRSRKETILQGSDKD